MDKTNETDKNAKVAVGFLALDNAAHKVFGTNKIGHTEAVTCKRCSGNFRVVYHEDRLYSVRCDRCKTVTLVKANNPFEAALAVQHSAKIKTRFCKWLGCYGFCCRDKCPSFGKWCPVIDMPGVCRYEDRGDGEDV